MGGFFGNLGAKLQSFMMGRNGADRLARWALGTSIVFLFINIFAPNVVCSVLSYVLLFYCVYRMFSGNIAARQAENLKFEEFLGKFTRRGPGGGQAGSAGSAKGSGAAAKGAGANGAAADAFRSKADGSKMTFVCENCGQSLSVPKGRGTLKVTCPKCSHQQKVKS